MRNMTGSAERAQGVLLDGLYVTVKWIVQTDRMKMKGCAEVRKLT